MTNPPTENEKGPINVTNALVDNWATDPNGPVALHLRQKLLPVEGEEGVIFPPTYVDIGYNIDSLSDGTKVATIDSVGSQANRMEPLFKAAAAGHPTNELANLVPQITIALSSGKIISILDAGHRLGDAIVRSSSLKEDAREAFQKYLNGGDASAIAKLAPTSLVFGVWDSRDTFTKLPRIVQSVVRAWNVDKLTRSAVYSPPVDYATLDVFSEEDKTKAEGDPKNPLAKRGFVNALATSAPGGIAVRGSIVRDVTVNLIALRRLDGAGDGAKLRRYVLGLSLVAASEPIDGFLRQGCLLTLDPSVPAQWCAVGRDGSRAALGFGEGFARGYAHSAATAFIVGPGRSEIFDKTRAKADVVPKPATGAGKPATAADKTGQTKVAKAATDRAAKTKQRAKAVAKTAKS